FFNNLLMVVACQIKPAACVSLQSPLAWHGLFPEYVPEITCVSTGRPQLVETPAGRISYRPIKPALFWEL
ncbi:MAG TPA: hypothetical protein DD477_10035, partial [Spirochaetaceae bacterium]|nr:hypothetical protein [Spirochaetaceae bacterium]HBO41539.1 hypothetical protein [Spirochaetaceae bacterium]HCQ87935.1 hypothetical protein [Spirochaetaceae bacterium]